VTDEQQQGQNPPDPRPLRPGGDEIPRKGYERRRDATGALRPPQAARPTSTPSSSVDDIPPIYDAPRNRRPAAPPRRGGQRAPRESGCYLPWWSLVILIIFVGAASFGLLYAAVTLGSSSLLEPTPRVVIVTSALEPSPIGTLPGAPTAIATFQTTPTPTLGTVEPTRTPLPGGCLLNDEVIVFGTGGVGLNLRDRPGGEVLFIAKEGERMLVIDGPQFFDDTEWCQVRSLSQGSSFGWAALSFLIAADALENNNE